MKEPVAIVTGASQGIGRATAIRLARDFSRIALAARDGKALEETIARQTVGRSLCRTDFYNGVIEQDGMVLERYLSSPSVASVQGRPVSTPD